MSEIDELKELMWTTYWEGYKLGYHVEEYSVHDRKTARTYFERWWSANIE